MRWTSLYKSEQNAHYVVFAKHASDKASMAKGPNRVQTDPPSSQKRNEVLIGILGFIGVLVTAGFSNWDKLFPPDNVVKAQFTGYQPTGDPQVELRYFTEITGMRESLRQMQLDMLNHFRQQAESRAGSNSESIAKRFKIVEEELPAQYDEIVNVFVPIASKYLSVAELQELNKGHL